MVYGRQLMQYMPYATGLMQPFIGPKNRVAYSNNRARTYTTVRARKPKGKTSFKSLVTNTLPSKQMSSQLTGAFTHSTQLTLCPTAQVSQGTANYNRVGDQIQLQALKLNGVYFSHTTAGAYTFRIIVGYSGEEYNNTTFATGLTTAQLFLPNTYTNFVSTGIINPRAFRVLHDSKIDLNSQIAAVADLASFSHTVSLGGIKFDYQESTSALGKLKNLYVVVVADVAGGAIGTTSSGTMVMSCDLIFK